ncbi:zinc finger protein 606 [Drosophila grimshawi]|uniref:GH18613 n=1 Tax=Drosophila grimshawi TaxID=7222 RepID=B4JHK3_DROGR|nr:zinc finger protein 606 [Drosophila grimshawi]EDV92830.1 GH18613 [Drosophila grimshawi]
MDVEKICRTCLSLSGPFLSIYDGGSGSCLVDMLREFTRTQPRREDNLPARVCLSCISEINHCYSFKLKCESSNRTLRQLLPNALPEQPEFVAKPTVATSEKSMQTNEVQTVTAEAQTDGVTTTDATQNTSLQEPAPVTVQPQQQNEEEEEQVEDEDEEEEEEQEFDYEFTEEQEGDEAPSKASAENIILHVEKDNEKYETEMVYNKTTGELLEQSVENVDKQKEYKYRLVSNGNGDTFISPEPATAAARKELMSDQPETRATSKRRRAAAAAAATVAAQLKEQPDERPPSAMLGKKPKINNFNETPATEMEELKANFHCDRCNAGFALEKSLIIHRRQNGCTHRNFKCNECKRVFVSMDHLTEHQATHGTFMCQECGLRCESMEQLGRHMVQTHKRNLRNQCNICQKVFTMLSTLRDHMRIHTGEKPFVCNVCGKGFTQNANLRQHKMRHSDIKRFKCELCSNSFVTKAELTSHARTHTGVKPYQCEVCSSKFTTSCSLAKHKRKHTGERPYACDLCPMRFTALNVLKNHRRTHTGERPFVCPFCSKSFTQRGDCQMHQRTHQGDKIYICPVCNEEFKTMNDMRTHLTIHEQDDKRLVHFTLLSNKENGSGALEEADDDSDATQDLL